MTRINLAALALSAAGIISLALSESYRGEAYVPVIGDVPTLGFGTTSGVRPGDRTTPERALVRLLNDASRSEQAVKRCAVVPMYQQEFDVWVEFTYNIGEQAFCSSTAAKKLNALDYAGACREMLRWDRVKGRVVKGLTVRRKREYEKCITSGTGKGDA